MLVGRLLIFLAIPCCLLLAGCSTVPVESARERFVAPRQLAAVYSDVELRALLAMAPDNRCAGAACEETITFRRRVAEIGARLEFTARRLSREAGTDAREFAFSVPAKSEVGALSSAAGTVVIFDGVRSLDPDDALLAFLIAREMGHVICEHHAENTGTSIAVSIVASLALPVAAILRNAATTVSALSSTSLAASAATTAASFAGARIIKAVYRKEQLREADLVALQLAEGAGWPPEEVLASLLPVIGALREDGWTGELLASAAVMAETIVPAEPDAQSPSEILASELQLDWGPLNASTALPD